VNAATSSQQVAWWEVHKYVTARLQQIEHWPLIGTPAWCELPDDDVRKIAAVYDAARHWALRVESCQQAMADAGSEISAATDWSALAREINQRTDFHAARRWLKRVAS
jgi:hypothetical protein